MVAYSNRISTRIYFDLWSLFSFSCLIVHNLKMSNSFISFPKAIDHIISRRCYFFTENKCLKRNKILEPRNGTVSLHAFICSIRKRRKWWLLDKHTSQIFVTDFLHHETKKSEIFFSSPGGFFGVVLPCREKKNGRSGFQGTVLFSRNRTSKTCFRCVKLYDRHLFPDIACV